jgi:hypothetical protein
MNRALNLVTKRAEKQEAPELHETFVDSGIVDVLSGIDHQVLFGRRGTGKTHAFGFLATEVISHGDVALSVDLRTIGSTDGIFGVDDASSPERASRLLVDLLGAFHDNLLNAVLEDSVLVEDEAFVQKADLLLASITSVRVRGEVEATESQQASSQAQQGGTMEGALGQTPSIKVSVNSGSTDSRSNVTSSTRRGRETVTLNFNDVARALRELADTLSSKRIWLLLDEWSSVPIELQPYLSEFLLRCVLPLQRFTVKIAAIEQQSTFRATIGGRVTGFQLGADVGAPVTMDDYLVYEGHEERAREFFSTLFTRHLNSVRDSTGQPIIQFEDSAEMIRTGFADTRGFDELVRAAEGVPRDAIYIAGSAASAAADGHITVAVVRAAARDWYQRDKSNALASKEQSENLLSWIVQKVIREKRARAFLVNQSDAKDPLLIALFDARVLHIVRRGYSAQDEPGVRYDVWSLDYGAYVDLLSTKYAPLGLLAVGTDDAQYADVDVPEQDLRAIRRAILNIADFYGEQSIQVPLDGFR